LDERDAEGIGVTPAMLEAGLDAWASFDERVEPIEDAIAAVYRAMRAADLIETDDGSSKRPAVRRLRPNVHV
jgi:hypothetical protein